MRFALLALAGLAALTVASCVTDSRAVEGPWCAIQDNGGGNLVSNCYVPNFEACRRLVIAGNRGYCGRNPRWNPAPR